MFPSLDLTHIECQSMKVLESESQCSSEMMSSQLHYQTFKLISEFELTSSLSSCTHADLR